MNWNQITGLGKVHGEGVSSRTKGKPGVRNTLFAVLMITVASMDFAGANSIPYEMLVNIRGTANAANYVDHPVGIYLDAGTYDYTPVGPSYDGALYTAYSFFSGGGLWAWSFHLADGLGPSRNIISCADTGGVHTDPSLAFASATPGLFTLVSSGMYYFGVGDSDNRDNTGGVSFVLKSHAVPDSSCTGLLVAIALITLAAYKVRSDRGSRFAKGQTVAPLE